MAKYEGMLAETVLINGHNGDQIDAYLARPLGGDPVGAVVLIHHMPGWDEASKEMARKLAYNGFATISPNLHFRQGQATPQDNSASIRDAGGMPDDRTMGDVQAAIDYLRTLPYTNGKVGIIGFCSGGRQVVLGACTLKGVDAAVNCGGGGVPPRDSEPATPASLFRVSMGFLRLTMRTGPGLRARPGSTACSDACPIPPSWCRAAAPRARRDIPRASSDTAPARHRACLPAGASSGVPGTAPSSR